MNNLPAAPMNSFAAALEKQVGAFDAAALPPVPTKAQSSFSIAELTHRAVLNAQGGGASAPTALAAEPAAPAQPLLNLPVFPSAAEIPSDPAQLEALATAQAQAELAATPGQPVSLDKQLSAAVATQTALGIQSQSTGAINAATPALDQQLKASVQAQSEADDKSQMPKWEQSKRPEKEMTEDQKLESLLDPGAAQFQEQVGGGVLTGQ